MVCRVASVHFSRDEIELQELLQLLSVGKQRDQLHKLGEASVAFCSGFGHQLSTSALGESVQGALNLATQAEV